MWIVIIKNVFLVRIKKCEIDSAREKKRAVNKYGQKEAKNTTAKWSWQRWKLKIYDWVYARFVNCFRFDPLIQPLINAYSFPPFISFTVSVVSARIGPKHFIIIYNGDSRNSKAHYTLYIYVCVRYSVVCAMC